MSCIELKHSNLYRHFVNSANWPGSNDASKYVSSIGKSRMNRLRDGDYKKSRLDWGKPLAAALALRSLFLNRQFILCLLYIICY